MLSSAAQRELKWAFPLKRCGPRAALSPPDHFPFRLQLSLLGPPHPRVFLISGCQDKPLPKEAQP